jgi:hypothetical protein
MHRYVAAPLNIYFYEKRLPRERHRVGLGGAMRGGPGQVLGRDWLRLPLGGTVDGGGWGGVTGLSIAGQKTKEKNPRTVVK